MPRKQKDSNMTRYSVNIHKRISERLEILRDYYGHQSIAETIRYVLQQGITMELQRKAQIEMTGDHAAIAEVLKEFTANPQLAGLFTGDSDPQEEGLPFSPSRPTMSPGD